MSTTYQYIGRTNYPEPAPAEPRPSDTYRAYADDLDAHSRAYAMAADAKGLRKDAARFLYAESLRLHSEAGIVRDRADELEDVGR